ncbi:hypothetical protein [Burkholderia vietnamiensis]|uniref:hypothetical protein n=1 Tax=Burkholderia vietnamiensis TaxID=60552 RepID=UPI001CF1BED9|nr:hypothetical protein [Burkholderia vietnamiensis]MCA8228230.1 hypothetical protein [Burkholderia vietnamiensis]
MSTNEETGSGASVMRLSSEPKHLRINVRQVSPNPDPQDRDVEGIYAVIFGVDDRQFPDAKRASMALDIFHAHQGIECLDDFEVEVIDEDGRVIEQDPDHVDYSASDDGEVEKISGKPVPEYDLKKQRHLPADQGSDLSDNWPAGATVKLESKTIYGTKIGNVHWAYRDETGQLMSLMSRMPLDTLRYSVIEERKPSEPRLFEGEWNHLFGPGRTETRCRIVVDVTSDTLVAAQAFDGTKWVDLSRAEREDLADSLFNANEISEAPEQSGLSSVGSLPPWASSREMPQVTFEAGQDKISETVTAWSLQSGDRIVTRTWPEGRLIVNTEPGVPQSTKIRVTYQGNGEFEDCEVFGASDAVIVRRKVREMSAEEERDLVRDLADYASRFADLNNEPEFHGQCRDAVLRAEHWLESGAAYQAFPRDLVADLVEYVQKYADSNGEPVDGHCRGVLVLAAGKLPEVAVPHAVRDHVTWALNRLREHEAALHGVQLARGNGHILALELKDRQEKIKQATDALDEFRALAWKNGVDAEAFIRSCGGVPDLEKFGYKAQPTGKLPETHRLLVLQVPVRTESTAPVADIAASVQTLIQIGIADAHSTLEDKEGDLDGARLATDLEIGEVRAMEMPKTAVSAAEEVTRSLRELRAGSAVIANDETPDASAKQLALDQFGRNPLPLVERLAGAQSVIGALASVEGTCLIHQGVLSLPDGTSINLRELLTPRAEGKPVRQPCDDSPSPSM